LPNRTIENTVREPFRCAHDVGRADRLVGRDQDARLDLGLERCTDDGQAAEDVVSQPLLDVRFDERHVLVSGGMVDRLDAMFAQHRSNKCFVEDGTEAGNDVRCTRMP
jgi:hypothetical protein